MPDQLPDGTVIQHVTTAPGGAILSTSSASGPDLDCTAAVLFLDADLVDGPRLIVLSTVPAASGRAIMSAGFLPGGGDRGQVWIQPGPDGNPVVIFEAGEGCERRCHSVSLASLQGLAVDGILSGSPGQPTGASSAKPDGIAWAFEPSVN